MLLQKPATSSSRIASPGLCQLNVQVNKGYDESRNFRTAVIMAIVEISPDGIIDILALQY